MIFSTYPKWYYSHNVKKNTFEHVRPEKILIRLRIRAVWSESSLDVFWIVKDAKFLHADIRAVWSDSSYGEHIKWYVFWRHRSPDFQYIFQTLPYDAYLSFTLHIFVQVCWLRRILGQCLQSSHSIQTSRFPYGSCPRGYHRTMKSNRAFVRNPGNDYL